LHPHICKIHQIFHPHLLLLLLLVLKKETFASPHLQDTPNIPSPPPPPPHETTKPTCPNESAQNNDAKVGAQSDVLADADKFVDDNSKKVASTFGPNTSVIALGETPPLLGKKALKKPSSIISKQQEKKLFKHKSSTPRKPL
jgi:hypothetical protein